MRSLYALVWRDLTAHKLRSTLAALMGLLGGLLGLVAGTGITAILAVTYGGNGWGLPGLDLWPAA